MSESQPQFAFAPLWVAFGALYVAVACACCAGAALDAERAAAGALTVGGGACCLVLPSLLAATLFFAFLAERLDGASYARANATILACLVLFEVGVSSSESARARSRFSRIRV